MQRLIKMIPALVLMVGLSGATLFAQQVYYVQSVKAKVLSAASFKSRLIAEVGRGYKLKALGKEGNWIKVKYGSLAGYVPALLLSPVPPIEKQGLIKGDESALRHNIRRRASTYTSAAAARGLTADDRRRLSKDEKVDYESLEQVESFTVSDAEVLKFMEESRP
jgi:uncharacterized protein YgiM (DUF1202 family)